MDLNKNKVFFYFKTNPFSLIMLGALIFNILWIWQSLGVIHSWNEAYYLMRAEYVAEGGSYLDGLFDNPPLFVYSLAALSKIFGYSVVAFRLLIVFCTIITTYCIYKIGLLIGNKKIAFSSASLFAFFPMIVIFSKIIQIDMFGIMFATLALFFALLGTNKNNKYLFLSGLFIGLAIFTKIPLGLMIIPIFILMFHKKINWKYYISLIFISALVCSPWTIYILVTKPSFLSKTAQSSKNFFGLGTMHASSAPIYQLFLTILSMAVLIFILFLYYRNKPKTPEEQALIFTAFIFAMFFAILPNHEYYLLTILPTIFLWIGLVYNKKCKKILYIFLFISIMFLVVKPIIEVNWEEAGEFIKQNHSDDVIIYSTNPSVTKYYTKQDVLWLNSIANFSLNNSILVHTIYDKTNLESLGLMSFIKDNFIQVKSIDDKIFVYFSKDLFGEE